ncbi:MAG: hypothetical protein ACI9TY_001684 [Alphaproteobacteria bacterium]|jgi:hypothetical protein
MHFIFNIIVAIALLSVNIEAQASNKDDFLVPYAKLLSKYVHPSTKNGIKGTGVDYLGWQSDPLHAEALELLLSVNTSEVNTKEDKLSFWTNAYNLLTIDLIIKQGERETIHNLGGLVGDPWNEFSWVIDGLEYTLGQIHHQTLRLLGEPRVHFALTCAAVSCPDLKNEPYWPEKIYSQLENRTALFIKNKGKGAVAIIPKQGRSHIRKRHTFNASQMFQWFTNDFDSGQIKHFIGRYIPLERAEFGTYLNHDWALNALKGKEPEARERIKKEPDAEALYE